MTPIIKKPSLDVNELSNYRPISNLPFMSKLLERLASDRLNRYIEEHNLMDGFQSAYRKAHSTETALMRVQNDIFRSMDNGEVTLLLMIDLSAAFDLVHHEILISRLKIRSGIVGKSLDWIISYLTNITQTCVLNNKRSSPVSLNRGVPQGSVLGPLLFSLFTTPLADIARTHSMQRHFYADDSQFYLHMKLSALDSNIQRINACVSDIREWMNVNHLKLNDTKTELVVFGTRYFLDRLPPFNIKVGEANIEPVAVVRNLGAHMDRNLTMERHVSEICKSSYMHFRNIGRVRKYITVEAANTLYVPS